MDVVVTEVANRRLNQFSGGERKRVLESLRSNLPAAGAAASDPHVRLETLDGSDLSVHRVGDLRILSRVFDVDQDDADEVVVLAIVPFTGLEAPEAAVRPDNGLIGTSTKIGRELLSKLQKEGF